jgi:catechol 2,3-dioxygenase-like lactoylglutathione lyase family enzyme
MPSVQVRYIVDDVDAAIDFYCRHLGFHEDLHPGPSFAMLSRGNLRLRSQNGSSRQAAAASRRPWPGRRQARLPACSAPDDDLAAMVETLRHAGVRFRNAGATGRFDRIDGAKWARFSQEFELSRASWMVVWNSSTS